LGIYITFCMSATVGALWPRPSMYPSASLCCATTALAWLASPCRVCVRVCVCVCVCMA
jgi:hypothetical protein